MKRLEQMKESLIACVQNQINGHLDQVDTKELGEAIDMIKDLEEAIYYCTITKAMKENEEEDERYRSHMMHGEGYPREDGRMYKAYYKPNGYESEYDNGHMMMYDNGMNSSYRSNSGNSGNGSSSYRDKRTNYMSMGRDPEAYERDYREGSSPMYRRMYMESKEMNQDNAKNMQDLENYVQELSKDIMEMIENSSTEEKQMLRQKITTLAAKIK